LLAVEVENKPCEAGVSIIDPFRKGNGRVDEEFCREREASPACAAALGSLAANPGKRVSRG
jgi:hypothetical protein